MQQGENFPLRTWYISSDICTVRNDPQVIFLEGWCLPSQHARNIEASGCSTFLYTPEPISWLPQREHVLAAPRFYNYNKNEDWLRRWRNGYSYLLITSRTYSRPWGVVWLPINKLGCPDTSPLCGLKSGAVATISSLNFKYEARLAWTKCLYSSPDTASVISWQKAVTRSMISVNGAPFGMEGSLEYSRSHFKSSTLTCLASPGRLGTVINNSPDKEVQKHLLILDKVYEKWTNIADKVWDPESSAVWNFIPWGSASEELFRFLLGLESSHPTNTLLVIWQEDTVVSMCRAVYLAFKHFPPSFTGTECSRGQQIRLREHS